jgi:hypothetical protein
VDKNKAVVALCEDKAGQKAFDNCNYLYLLLVSTRCLFALVQNLSFLLIVVARGKQQRIVGSGCL